MGNGKGSSSGDCPNRRTRRTVAAVFIFHYQLCMWAPYLSSIKLGDVNMIGETHKHIEVATSGSGTIDVAWKGFVNNQESD